MTDLQRRVNAIILRRGNVLVVASVVRTAIYGPMRATNGQDIATPGELDSYPRPIYEVILLAGDPIANGQTGTINGASVTVRKTHDYRISGVTIFCRALIA